MGDCCRLGNIISYIVRALQFLSHVSNLLPILHSYYEHHCSCQFCNWYCYHYYHCCHCCYIISWVKYWSCSNRHLFWWQIKIIMKLSWSGIRKMTVTEYLVSFCSCTNENLNFPWNLSNPSTSPGILEHLSAATLWSQGPPFPCNYVNISDPNQSLLNKQPCFLPASIIILDKQLL